MAKRKAYIKLQCESCKKVNYNVHKSKQLKAGEKKIELKKFCKFEKKHTKHKEAKR